MARGCRPNLSLSDFQLKNVRYIGIFRALFEASSSEADSADVAVGWKADIQSIECALLALAGREQNGAPTP